MAAEKRFLVINPFGIGDVLFSTAMLRCLKNALPASRMFYLGNKKTAALLKKPSADRRCKNIFFGSIFKDARQLFII